MKRCKGRRRLANFENLPLTTQVYELSAEERACPCCGVERQEIGAEESWQIEYIPACFERIQHVRKKYACAKCEGAGEAPQIEVAAPTSLKLVYVHGVRWLAKTLGPNCSSRSQADATE